MRKLLVALLLFGLGVGGAVIVAKPAGARTTVDGTLTGVVGPSATISLKESGATVTNLPPGTYEFDITDNASTHNFDICASASRCTSLDSIDKTSVNGTGSTVWDITLAAGTYTYQCDVHTSMTHSFTVGTATTTTVTTSTATTTATTTAPTTTTTTVQTTTTAPTTTSATTTTTAATTTAPTTTQSGGGGGVAPLTVHIVSAKGTVHAVTVKVSSSKHGRAVAELLKGAKRLAGAAHAVPGTLTLKSSHGLAQGSYTVKLTVTAGGRHATAKKTVRIR